MLIKMSKIPLVLIRDTKNIFTDVIQVSKRWRHLQALSKLGDVCGCLQQNNHLSTRVDVLRREAQYLEPQTLN